jgi:pimeloyl-ACP methyl ester carboxylesterase
LWTRLTVQVTLQRLICIVAVEVLLISTLILVIGLLYQAYSQARDRRELAPPGVMIEVNGAKMHLDCRGFSQPTIVLEAGAMGFAATWEWVAASLRETHRVCTYDRAGLGWSTGQEGIRRASDATDNLNTLLTIAGEQGPFVIVGHSLGGLLSLAFANKFPTRVLGLILVDPAHPDMLTRIPGAESAFALLLRRLDIATALARIGVTRASGIALSWVRDLPSRARREAVLFATAPAHLRAAKSELLAWDYYSSAARNIGATCTIPLLVLSAGRWAWQGRDAEGQRAVLNALHAELANWSATGTRVTIKDADHYSILLNPAHAKITAYQIDRFVQRIPSGPVTPPPNRGPFQRTLVHRFHETGHLRGIHSDSIALYSDL